MEPDTLRPSEEKTDPSERLEKAKKLKEEGNAKFKVEDFPGARKAYAEALRITQKMPEGGVMTCEYNGLTCHGWKVHWSIIRWSRKIPIF
ncbi:unnamed protein product [Durusdinium trenchii]|uniref:Uncharacterized protein n=1 Tax=Durusdinium trenchii TaxID=1381693 RepID=A0ABP0M7C1_9DINO